MSQAIANSNQLSGDRSQQGELSEMMKLYLASDPSTTTERLVQGSVMSDENIMRSLKQKETELDALREEEKRNEKEHYT
ncbi:hypothetical protein F4818DRAFT_435995 [Hypoxylon cercidicola]|nr:hypothetical protein F4818DRAFT_435995 [Hypoxylon cercidicola]